MNRPSASLPAERKVIAVTGKGGTGKTTFSAIMAKIFVESGYKVLAVDADPPISLAYALGAIPGKTIGEMRAKMITDPEEKRRIKDKAMAKIIADESMIHLDGLSLLILGQSEGPGCYCSINDLLKYGVESISKSYDITLIDCEAGIEQVNRRVVDGITHLVMMTDATHKGLRTAAHLEHIAQAYGIQGNYRKGLVFNRQQGKVQQLEEAVQRLGVEVIGYIPEDKYVSEFDLSDRAITGLPADSPSLQAVRAIIGKMGIPV